MKLKRILFNNLGLKMLALVLALVTWVYIGEVLNVNSDRTVLQKILASSKFVSRRLTVAPNFVGEEPEGCELIRSEITVDPQYVIVLGPAKVLGERNEVLTKPIDLSEYTKPKTIEVGLEGFSRSVNFQKTKIQVYLPVKKVENPEKAQE